MLHGIDTTDWNELIALWSSQKWPSATVLWRSTWINQISVLITSISFSNPPINRRSTIVEIPIDREEGLFDVKIE